MKHRSVIFEQLKSQPYFEKQAIRQLGEQYRLKSATLDAYISQAIRHREIIPLRKGLYLSADFFNANKNDISYIFYLANILRRPSYVSSWTALQFYDLTTELIHTTTSVTSKVTRDYKTRAGNFSYQHIQPTLFSSFTIAKDKFEFFIASPAKALFDLLYFRTRQFRGIKLEDIDPLIEDLRIDIDEMEEHERLEFYDMVRRFLRDE